MFQKSSTRRRHSHPADVVDSTDEPRGHVLREDPLERMRRERDELAARAGLGAFG